PPRPPSITAGGSVTSNVVLTGELSGLLSGKIIKFYIDKNQDGDVEDLGENIYSGTTDVFGKISYTYTPSDDDIFSGEYFFGAYYEGDTSFAPSGDADMLTITDVPTKLTTSDHTAYYSTMFEEGQPTVLGAILQKEETNVFLLEPVDFYIDGSHVSTADLWPDDRHSIGHYTTTGVGIYNLQAKFAGSAEYDSCESEVVTFTVIDAPSPYNAFISDGGNRVFKFGLDPPEIPWDFYGTVTCRKIETWNDKVFMDIITPWGDTYENESTAVGYKENYVRERADGTLEFYSVGVYEVAPDWSDAWVDDVYEEDYEYTLHVGTPIEISFDFKYKVRIDSLGDDDTALIVLLDVFGDIVEEGVVSEGDFLGINPDTGNIDIFQLSTKYECDAKTIMITEIFKGTETNTIKLKISYESYASLGIYHYLEGEPVSGLPAPELLLPENDSVVPPGDTYLDWKHEYEIDGPPIDEYYLDFSDKWPAGWKLTKSGPPEQVNAGWDETIGYSGASSLKSRMTMVSPDNSVVWHFSFPRAISSGSEYTFSAWVMTSPGYTGESSFTIMFFDGMIPLLFQDINIPISTTANSNWVEYTGTFTAPAGYTNLYFLLSFAYQNGQGTIWFDNLKMLGEELLGSAPEVFIDSGPAILGYDKDPVFTFHGVDSDGKIARFVYSLLGPDYNGTWHEIVPETVIPETSPPDDPYFWSQWGLNNEGQAYYNYAEGGLEDPTVSGTTDSDIDMLEAWSLISSGSQVIVAVIDTGVDYNHSELSNQMWINTGEDLDDNGVVDASDFNGIDDDGNGYIDDIRGWNFGEDNNDVSDDNPDADIPGHGTIVAGIIAAEGGNNIGISGICPFVKIMPLVLSSNNFNIPDEVGLAIRYAANNGARVINIGDAFVQDRIEVELAVAYAYSKGCVIVSGTSNNNTDELYYPAAYDNVISVSSVDSDDKKTGLSGYGGWIDISAPGKDILSLASGSIVSFVDVVKLSADSGYCVAQGGPGFAAPYISGLAALLLSQ
ncbi:MAG: S8 family serine peptidase, partial [Candidatus Aureabacteria bacterium]|nr:S8 family serine peptidase [Candidatus Auribacterota bacterium]